MKEVITNYWCDACRVEDKLTNSIASYTIINDGAIYRDIDLCPEHDARFAPWLQLGLIREEKAPPPFVRQPIKVIRPVTPPTSTTS